MASGGSNYPGGQNTRVTVNSTLNRNTESSDFEIEHPGPPWLLTANNLSLHTSASENRLSKKQRNKTKPRLFPITDSSVTPESSPQATGGSKGDAPKLSSQPPKLPFYSKREDDTSRQKKPVGDRKEFVSDTGDSGAEAPIDLRYVVNQRRQKRNAQNGLKGSTPSQNYQQASSKQDNTNKLPDTSVLVERLMHLRDCISQVTSIMQNLEKTDGNQTRSHLGNLDHMLDQLKNEEHENLELLQQVLTFREGAAAAAAAVAGHQQNVKEVDSSSCSEVVDIVPARTHNMVDNNHGDEDEDEDEGEAEERMKQNKLLQKMVASQKKLVSLKEQQSALLSMQRKAENRLKEVKAFHERLMESSLSMENGEWLDSDHPLTNGHIAVPQETEKPLKLLANAAPVAGVVNQNYNEVVNWDNELERQEGPKLHSVTMVKKGSRKVATNSAANNHSLPTTLENISEQLNSQVLSGQIHNGCIEEDQIPSTDNSELLTDLHRKKLENKLRELQEKKQQMDLLLAELSSLQVAPQTKEPQSSDTSLKPMVNGAPDYQSVPPASGPSSHQNSHDIVESVDTVDKFKQLEGLKKKLVHLKLLTDNLETGNLNNDPSDPALLRGRSQTNKKNRSLVSSTLKSDNLRRDHTSPGFPARRHYEAEGRANEDGDSTQVTQGTVAAQALTSPLAPLTPAQEQIFIEEHAEIEAKVSQLLAAKSKLQQLHGLMGAVHQFKQTGEPFSNEAQQLLTSLHQGFASLTSRSAAVDAGCNYDEENAQIAPPLQPVGFERLNEVEEQLLRQQHELESLSEERKRLLAMQDQLNALQQQQIKQLKNIEQRSSGEGGSLARKDSRPNQITSTSLSNLLAAGISSEASRQPHGRQDNLQRQQSARSSISESAHTSTKEVNNSKVPNQLNVSRNQPNKYDIPVERISEQNLADLNEELNHSLALRDELQHQKAVLQELLRQEHSKQLGFSQNQDLRSQSGSSEKSELVEGSSSVMAPDTTVAATWGGSSTQDNLDDEGEEEQLESLEEQDEDEDGSGNEMSKNSVGRLQTLLQPCIDHQPLQDSDSYQRRRNNRSSRSHLSKRGLLNQWRRNFQNISSSGRKNEQQPCYQQPPPEIVQPNDSVTLNQAVETQAATADDPWRQFTKHIQSQLEQTNLLCQSVLKDQQALSNMLFSFSVSSSSMTSNQSSPSDVMRYYNHLQQQQQLLFSLSHCYHMLYLQQVEIIHLQHYFQQNHETEGGAIPRASPNPHLGTDDFRTWCLASPWLTSPLPSPFVSHATSTAPFCFNPLHPAPSPFSLNTNNTLGGVTPAQDERGAAETLNNQVPPGTRANNFLDNFRSYSRPNLLSATVAPTKSKESVVPLAELPQIRPYSFCGGTAAEIPACQTVIRGHRPRSEASVPAFSSAYSIPSVNGRRSLTPSASPLAANSVGGVRPRVKRPNQNQEQGNSVRRTPGCLNLLSLYDPARLSTACGGNLSQNSPNQQHPTAEHTISIRSSSRDQESNNDASNCDTLRDSIYMEVTSLISNFEQQPDLLQDLLKQLQQIGGPSSNNNDRMCHLDSNKPAISTSSTSTKRKTESRGKAQSPHNLASLADFTRGRLGSDSLSANLHETVQRDADNLAVRLAEHNSIESPIEESSSSTNSWPKGSSATGAIQKKYGRHLTQSSSQSIFVPPESAEDAGISSDNLVKQTMLSLVPFLRNHLGEDCTSLLQAQLCNHILNALQSLPIHQPLLRFFRSQLLQALQQVLAKYSGRRVRECEEEMLMEITEVVMKEMAIQKIMQKKKEGRGSADWNSVSANRGSNLGTNLPGTDFDSPHSNESRFQGSEGFSENDISNTENKTESRDWVEQSFNKEDLGQSEMEYSAQKLPLDLQPDRLDVRAAPDGLAAAPPPPPLAPHMVIVHPMSPRLLEEESGYDCDAEGETEPEVEAETDDTKDLAEADQSAGQQISERLPHRECLRDRQAFGGILAVSSGITGHRNNIGEVRDESLHLVNGDMGDSALAGAEAMPLGQTSAAEGESEELTLDDIPTKLETMTMDETRRQDEVNNQFPDPSSSDSSGIDKDSNKGPASNLI